MLKHPYFIVAFALLACTAPKSASQSHGAKIQALVSNSAVFNRAFTGFTLMDPESGEILADWNGDHYFTPASNLKIMTLFACRQLLGDSMPAAKVALSTTKDTLFFQGLADPTFLNPLFNSWQPLFKQLRRDSAQQLVYVRGNFMDKRYGPGWSWDDMTDSYSPERQELPIYGGLMRVYYANDSLRRRVDPPYLQSQLAPRDMKERYPLHGFNYRPEDHSGYTNFWPESKDSIVDVPMVFLHLSPLELLEDTLGKGRVILEKGARVPRDSTWQILYSTPMDTILRSMMHHSDNFLAEQLLLACSAKKFNLFSQEQVIRWVLDSTLQSLPQPLKWVDGSGLSRYNMLTPRSVSHVLYKLWRTEKPDFLRAVFPAGGVSGTISDWYEGPKGQPYVFAKTGTLSAVHCLSGYVQTKSGKTLIFSFMHNNFQDKNRLWKQEMQKVLREISDWQ
jgi:serine-type D-Ala-D-Ala carboxypeptidase/endopeptidase (penicillin-binding protein 4)